MNAPVLRIQCSDQKGLVAKITHILFHHDLNIVANDEFVDPEGGTFFMRTEVDGQLDEARLLSELTAALPAGASVELVMPEPKRMLVLGTREAHCLGDILVRSAFDEWSAEILGVISNHDTLEALVSRFNHPYHHVPHDDCSREEHEQKVCALIDDYNPDVIVLAKYMRILTPAFVERYGRRLVNIHHSFLPAFIGANPYKQAYERGVKIIGATAHFVTQDLDEGPIIAQGVKEIAHHHGPRDLALAGRDVEKIVLARALKLIFEDRVFVLGNKTVIFD